MIDLWGVAANGLWVLGLAVVVAALSWANWEAKTSRARLRAVLTRPPIQRTWGIGLALFCAGLAATVDPWWQRALWGMLSAAWIVQVVWPIRRNSARQGTPPTAGREGAESDTGFDDTSCEGSV